MPGKIWLMHPDILLSIAREIAQRVVEIIHQSSDLGAYTGTVGESGDRTRYGDHLVENGLRAIIPFVLEKYRVGSAVVVSEEAGQWVVGSPPADRGIFMLIDPIDGSRNMRPHPTPRPFLGFSIGLGTMADLTRVGTFEAVQVGLIRDIFHDEEYYAVRGEGAFLNKMRLQTSPVTELSQIFLGLALDRRGEELQHILDAGALALMLSTKCQRRLGCTTLDVCRVASGDYDAHVSLSGGAKIHDVAAAKLLVEEAGGRMCLYRDGLDATNGRWLSELYNSNGRSLQSFSFKLIAAGSETLLQKIKEMVRM